MNHINQILNLNQVSNQADASRESKVLTKASQEDMLTLMIVAMMETVATTTDGTILHAKIMQNNSDAQEALNKEVAKLPWHKVPKMDIHKYTVRNTHYIVCAGGRYVITRYTYQHKTSYLNATVVQNQMAKNQGVSQQRQVMQERLTVLQQESSVDQSNISSMTDNGIQATKGSQFFENAIRQIMSSITNN